MNYSALVQIICLELEVHQVVCSYACVKGLTMTQHGCAV